MPTPSAQRGPRQSSSNSRRGRPSASQSSSASFLDALSGSSLFQSLLLNREQVYENLRGSRISQIDERGNRMGQTLAKAQEYSEHPNDVELPSPSHHDVSHLLTHTQYENGYSLQKTQVDMATTRRASKSSTDVGLGRPRDGKKSRAVNMMPASQPKTKAKMTVKRASTINGTKRNASTGSRASTRKKAQKTSTEAVQKETEEPKYASGENKAGRSEPMTQTSSEVIEISDDEDDIPLRTRARHVRRRCDVDDDSDDSDDDMPATRRASFARRKGAKSTDVKIGLPPNGPPDHTFDQTTNEPANGLPENTGNSLHDHEARIFELEAEVSRLKEQHTTELQQLREEKAVEARNHENAIQEKHNDICDLRINLKNHEHKALQARVQLSEEQEALQFQKKCLNDVEQARLKLADEYANLQTENNRLKEELHHANSKAAEKQEDEERAQYLDPTNQIDTPRAPNTELHPTTTTSNHTLETLQAENLRLTSALAAEKSAHEDLMKSLDNTTITTTTTTNTNTAARFSTPFPRPSQPPLTPSTRTTSPTSISPDEQTRTTNVRKTYLKVRRKYDALHAAATRVCTCTRGMELRGFGEFGMFMRQLRVEVEGDMLGGREGREEG